MSEKSKSILMRFVKAFVGGFTSSILVVGIAQASGWANFTSILDALLIVGLTGGISGLLLALQKWATWIEES